MRQSSPFLSLMMLYLIAGASFALNSPNNDSQSYNTRHQANQLFYRSDAEISHKVKASILADKETKNAKITISTNEGMVELSGTVKTEAEKEKIVTLTRHVRGVRLVKDEIEVEKPASSH